MKVIDQGKETVLRVDDDADWSRETERDKGGGGDRSRKEGWGEEEGFGSNKEEARRDGQTEEEVVLEMATSTIFITKIFFFFKRK